MNDRFALALLLALPLPACGDAVPSQEPVGVAGTPSGVVGPSAGDVVNEDVPPLLLVLPDGTRRALDRRTLDDVTPTRIPDGVYARPETDTRAWRVDGFILRHGGAKAVVHGAQGAAEIELDQHPDVAILRVVDGDRWRLEWMRADGTLARDRALSDVTRLEIRQLPGLPSQSTGAEVGSG